MSSSDFFETVPVQTDFDALAEDSCYTDLPDDWIVGTADIIDSTKEVAAGRYKVVNTVGAAVISAQINGTGGKPFPFVFGGDGAVFAIWPEHRQAAETALVAVQNWANEEFGIGVRVALIPVSDIRKAGKEVRVARFQASDGVDYAMFSGGGAAWVENQMKSGQYTIDAPEDVPLPDLTGLSCRWTALPSKHGVILSVVIQPNDNAMNNEYHKVLHEIISLVGNLDRSGHPVSEAGPGVSWPPEGLYLEAHATRGEKSLFVRKIQLGLETLIAWIFFKLNLKAGGFDPEHYAKQTGRNADYRKFEDGLKMTLDVDPETKDKLNTLLEDAQERRVLKFGLFEQDHAMMTCIVPSITNDSHIHFVDGGAGGYTQAASQLKAGKL